MGIENQFLSYISKSIKDKVTLDAEIFLKVFNCVIIEDSNFFYSYIMAVLVLIFRDPVSQVVRR